MSKQIKITITLDQPMYDETGALLKLYIRDAFHMVSSYSPDNVLIEEVNTADQRKIGLNDKFGTPITSGCICELTGTLRNIYKGDLVRCIWNKSQHRYGFVLISNKDSKEVFDDIIDCHFYATPRNASKLKVIG